MQADKNAMREAARTSEYREHLREHGWACVHLNPPGPNRRERRRTFAQIRRSARKRAA